MNEEIALLTNEAKEMEKALAQQEEITDLASNQTPRWLSLSTYKIEPIHWEWENELNESLVLAAPPSSVLQSPICDCQICQVKQDEGQSEMGSESEGDLEPAEKANCRVLGVLRCYQYNLKHGALVTGSKVDVRVEAALKRLLGWVEVAGNCRGEEATSKDVKESWEISDEERVVVEIDSYGRELVEIEEVVSDDAVNAAIEILDWARTKGTANGREMDLTSLYTSLEMIEC
jgi:hypothetical protein